MESQSDESNPEIRNAFSRTTSLKIRKIIKEADPVGFKCLRFVINDPVYKIALLISNYIAIFCVLLDFVRATSRMDIEKYCDLKTISEPLLVELIFCMDNIFLLKTITEFMNRRSFWKHGNKVLVFDIISLLPIEILYVIMNGEDMMVFYVIRMRYLLRAVRYLLDMRIRKYRRCTPLPMIIQYLMVFTIITMLALNIRFLIICTGEDGCRELSLKSFVVEFFEFFSKVSDTGMNIVDKNLMDRVTTIQLFFSVTIFICLKFSSWKLVCCYMKELTSNYELATACDLSLWNVKAALSLRSKFPQWNHLDKIYMKYLKNCLNLYWEGVNFFESRQSDVKGFDIGNLPPIIYTEIMLDLSWNLFKHSVLFQNEEKHVLRKMAQFAHYQIFMAGEPIYTRGAFKTFMMYIVSGVVRITSAENGETSLICLSPGTCLGEINLFCPCPAVSTVICETYCELVVIHYKDMWKLKEVYPKVYQDLKFKMWHRLSEAKIYNFIRKRDIKTKCDPSMRYIKQVLRRGERLSFFFSNVQIEEEDCLNETIFCADYLSMYMINDDYRNDIAENIVKTGFFFKLNPNSSIIRSWNFIINCLIFSVCIIYPIGSVALPTDAENIYKSYMDLITIFFVIDFISLFFIAVQDKDGIHTSFERICNVKIYNWENFLSLMSSIPIELIATNFNADLSERTHKILEANRLLKVGHLLKALNSRRFFNARQLVIQSFLKSLIYFIIIVLIGSSVMVGYDYIKYTEIKALTDFYSAFLTICFVFQTYFASSIISVDFSGITPANFLPLVILQYIFFLWKYATVSEVVAGYSLVYASNIRYSNFIADNKAVLHHYNYSAEDKKKIFDILHMHYSFKKGLYLMKRESVKLLIGDYMFKYQQNLLYEDVLLKEKLFQGMKEKTLKDIIDIAKIVLIPKGQLIEYAGAVAKEIYLIMKGNCGYLNKTSVLQKTLTPGDSLFVIEFVFQKKILHNVIALTDCKLLVLSSADLMRKFTEHLTEYYTLKQIGKELNQKSKPISEIDLSTLKIQKEDEKSFFNFNYHVFIQGFGKVSLMSMAFLKFVIKPNGKFWFYWEISRLIFAYTAAFVGFLPFFDYRDFYSPYFFVFRLLDLTALADIILRHYVVFYNELKIEVKHPWKTACNYWKTSLFVDVVAAFPFDWVFMKSHDNLLLSIFWPRFNRVLQLYRIIGFKKYCTECRMEDMMIIVIILYICIIYLFYNFLFSTFLFGNCNYDTLTNIMVCPNKEYKVWPTYFFYMYRYHKNIYNVGFSNDYYDDGETWKHCLICLWGYLYWITFSCIITSMKLFSNTTLTAYQIQMQRLVAFLNLRTIDEKVTKEIIKHFEYLWFLREGREIHDAFSEFNKCCFEDMLYSQYANNLQSSILFHGFPRALLKELLANEEVVREFFLITGIIINVNDVRNKIYIIFKGEVDVLGPDSKNIVCLTVGSAFGCLDNLKNMRSTLLYVAKTHCEIIAVPSKVFFVMCTKFPDFHENYVKLLGMTNADYIKSFGNKSGAYSSNTDIPHVEVKKRYYFWLAFVCTKIFQVRQKNKYVEIFMIVNYFFGFFIECFQKSYTNDPLVLVILCYLLDAIHYYNVYLSFATAFENEYGLLVSARKLIALRYIRQYTQFLLDLFSGIPFELIAFAFYNTDSFWKIWGLCRYNRLIRILFLFKYINAMKRKLNVNVTFASLAKVVLYVLTLQQLTVIFLSQDEGVIAYCDGIDFCLYFQSLRVQFYFMSGSCTVQLRSTKSFEYLKQMNYSIPYSLFLLAINITMLVVFAEGVSSFQIKYCAQYKYETYVVNFNKTMDFRGVSLPLKKRINKYLENLYAKDRVVQFPMFLIIAPVYLREAVLNAMFGFHLRKHPVFAKCHVDLLRQIASTFRTIYLFKGDFLVHKGDINKEMFFLHSGEIYGLSEDTLYHEAVERIFKVGDCIGYEQLFCKLVGHEYSYKVAAEAVVLVLTAENVLPLLDFFPASKHTLFNDA